MFNTLPAHKNSWNSTTQQPSHLTYDVRLALAAVIISSTDFHVHEGTDDAAAIFGHMASSQHLVKSERASLKIFIFPSMIKLCPKLL